MKKWNWLLLFSAMYVQAQYTEIINSNRPGISESPYSVGVNVLQLEGGGFYTLQEEATSKESENTNRIKETLFGGELLTRYGLFIDELEVSANIAYQKNRIENVRSFHGFSNFTIGLKYLIFEKKYEDKSLEIRSWKKRHAFDKKRLIPTIGIYAGYNTNFLSKDYKAKKGSYKFAILLQNNLSERFVIVTNLIADEIGQQDPFYAYSLSMTYAFTGKFSFFFENYGQYRRFFKPEYKFGGGFAYLLSKDLQFDIYGQNMPFERETTWTFGLGVSWRLDNFSKYRN